MTQNHIAQSTSFHTNHRIGVGEKIEYGYKDGGRRVSFTPEGHPASPPNREIIVAASPAEDLVLKQVIQIAKTEMAEMTSIAQKVAWLGPFVDRLLQEGDPDRNDAIMDQIAGEGAGSHIGREFSLGTLIQARSGVCRHRSLLFKVLADETGIPCALVRGNYQDENGFGGGHAWNEVLLENGDRLLVDVMHKYIGHMNDPKVTHYKDVEKKPLYDAAGLAHIKAGEAEIRARAGEPPSSSLGSDIPVGGHKWQFIEKSGVVGAEVSVQGVSVQQQEALLSQLGEMDIPAGVTLSSVQGGQAVIRVMGARHTEKIEECIDAVQALSQAPWMDVTDRSGQDAAYLDIGKMTAEEVRGFENALALTGIAYKIKPSSLNGGTHVIAVHDPLSLAKLSQLSQAGLDQVPEDPKSVAPATRHHPQSSISSDIRRAPGT